MEHRWGERMAMGIPVRVTVQPLSAHEGRLVNVSMSGALIQADVAPRVLSRVQVRIQPPGQPLAQPTVLTAYVVRRSAAGFGIEWCEFAPREVFAMLNGAGSGAAAIAPARAPLTATR